MGFFWQTFPGTPLTGGNATRQKLLDTPLDKLDKMDETPAHGTRHPLLDKSPPYR